MNDMRPLAHAVNRVADAVTALTAALPQNEQTSFGPDDAQALQTILTNVAALEWKVINLRMKTHVLGQTQQTTTQGKQ